ncbi:ubiquitin-like protein 7 [Diachasmimorpha longicaudata]|uniref:ubiquitin-like protein 7 n=1 Tax=Diachasmimorpha longicaudata TaxID=58733 RepID=UPI0030B8DF1F
MGAQLNLGVRSTSGAFSTIKLSDVDLKTRVEDLRLCTAQKIELPKDSFELIHCGCILEDDASLESCGLKDGSMVHVLKKKEAEKPVPAKPITEGSILQIANAFKAFNENPTLRNALHRLSKRPDVIENIIVTTPGLIDDSVAIAMLQDPDLMAHFNDTDTVRRAAELHPVLAEAALSIVAAVHEESHRSAVPGTGPSTLNAPSAAYSYSLDNLSDDEEMAGDSSQSSDSNTAITAAQLAAALSRANPRAAFPLSHSSSSTSAGSNSGLITTEMFSQAMQQAFASTPGSTTSMAPPAPAIPPLLPQSGDLQRQLAQMHEIGLQDDATNVMALQFTNGDVQAAIELVFSGFSDN